MIKPAGPVFAGYFLSTDIPLPALPAGAPDASRPWLRVYRASSASVPMAEPLHWDHQWRGNDGSMNLQVVRLPQARHDDPARYWLQVPGLCDFVLSPAIGDVAVAAPDNIAANTLEHLLLDQAIPRLLAGAGHLVVHASLVRIGDQVIAFLGHSGWGKSTLAALFHQRSYPALCDDCVVFETDAERTSATPSYPGLRLFSDSIEQALANAGPSDSVSDYSHKQRIIRLGIPPEALGAHPLAAIFLLDDPQHGGDSLRIEPITAAAACMAIIEHGFRLNPAEPAESVRQLQSASTVARNTPAYLLHNPRDFRQQDALIDCILDHLATPHHIER